MPKAATTKRHIGGSNRHDGPEIKKKTAVFKMNKELGQHLLKNPDIARRIVDKAEIRPSDIVLEVGPGTGNLTETILERAKKVIVVEMDPRMCAELVKRFQGRPVERKLEILQGDVIKMPQLPYHDICISNTPYQISSPLVFKLLNQARPPRTSVLMFQEEFALRLVARPGDSLYGRLAANSQMYANISLVMKVGRNNFRPPPQVESAVVKMMIKEPKPQIDAAEWDGLLRVVFQRPNRIVAANFKGKNVLKALEKNYVTWLSMSGQGGDMAVDYKDLVKQKVDHALTVSEVGDKRAIKCDETDFLRLLLEFNKQGIHFNGDRINDDDDKMMDA